jgi:hypothetical protein
MKQMLLLLLIPLAVFSQQRDSVVSGNKVFYYGAYYVDSVYTDLKKTFLDYDNIEEIAQLKNPEPFTSRQPGAILLTRKNKTPLIRLDSFIKNSETLKNEPRVNIIVNEKVIEHPEEYFVEEAAIAKIAILKSSDGVRGDHRWRTPAVIITLKTYM